MPSQRTISFQMTSVFAVTHESLADYTSSPSAKTAITLLDTSPTKQPFTRVVGDWKHLGGTSAKFQMRQGNLWRIGISLFGNEFRLTAIAMQRNYQLQQTSFAGNPRQYRWYPIFQCEAYHGIDGSSGFLSQLCGIMYCKTVRISGIIKSLDKKSRRLCDPSASCLLCDVRTEAFQAVHGSATARLCW